MTTKPGKLTYDRERRQHALFARCIREADNGYRKLLLAYLRSDTPLSKEQRCVLADWLGRLDIGGGKKPQPVKDVERFIIHHVRKDIEKARTKLKLSPGKQLPRGTRQKIFDKIVGRLAVAGELNQLPISVENIKRELHRGPKRLRPSTRKDDPAS